MAILAGILMGLMVFGWLASMAQIGKPREPLTPGVMAVTTVIVVLQGIVFIWVMQRG